MKRNNYIDVPLLICVISLMVFGIIMVYSASSYTAKIKYGNEFYFMIKQIIGVILGSIIMVILSLFDYHKLEKIKYIILALSILLLILVFVPGIGEENYGAKRWIKLPFFTIQASELAKFGFIIYTASYMSKNYKKITTFKGLLPVLLIGGIICLLIMLEPNMSITMCVIFLTFTMLFMGGGKIKHFLFLSIPLLCLVPLLIIIEPYRLKRLLAFLNPWENPLGEGYQLIQSYYALGSGGLFGVGLFNSRQKYLFLPFAESDFIFSIICSELGFIGGSIVILVYVILCARAIKISLSSVDRFGAYLSGGIACLIAIQVLINIAVVTGSIPPTGLPLPFISSGSSSLIVFCSSIGLIFSVNRYRHNSIKCLLRK